MLQKSTKVWSMTSIERPVFRQLRLALTNSLHTKTSSLSEWQAKRSHTGQDPSQLGCTPVQEPDTCWPFQQQYFFLSGVLLHSCVQRWCQQEALHYCKRTEESSARPEKQNCLSSPSALGEITKLPSPPRTSPSGVEGSQGSLEVHLLHHSSHRHHIWAQRLGMVPLLLHQTLVWDEQ